VNRANYHSPRREQAAAATRETILDAAGKLFSTTDTDARRWPRSPRRRGLRRTSSTPAPTASPSSWRQSRKAARADPDAAETLARRQPSRALGLGRPGLTRRPGSVLRDPAGVTQINIRGHFPAAPLSGHKRQVSQPYRITCFGSLAEAPSRSRRTKLQGIQRGTITGQREVTSSLLEHPIFAGQRSCPVSGWAAARPKTAGMLIHQTVA
jgi:hypothetical protein